MVYRRRRRVTAEWLGWAIVATWGASTALTSVADLMVDGSTGIWARTLFPMDWQMFCPGLLVALAPHMTSPAWRKVLIDFPRRRGALVVTAVLLIAAALVFPHAPLRYGLNVWALVVDLLRPVWGVGFGLLLAIAVQARPVRSRIALRIGLVSYGVYLYHAVVLALLDKTWIPLARQGLDAYLVHFAVLAGSGILLALASWRFIEEPLIRRARKVGERRSARGPIERAPAS